MKTNKEKLGKVLVTGLLLSFLHSGCGEKSKIQSHLEAGEAFYEKGKFDEAKVEFLNLRSKDSKNALAYERLGEIWLLQGSPYRALPYLTEARKLAPENVAVRIHLAEGSLAVGANIDARKHVVEVLAKDPAHVRALTLLAETASSEELVRETREFYRDPGARDSLGVKLGMGVLAIREQDIEGGEEIFRNALEEAPESSAVHYALAYTLRIQNKLEEAETHYRRAAELSPDRSSEKLAYARFLIEGEKEEQARAFLQGVTKTAPDFLPGWVLLAQLAVDESDYPRAEELLEHVFTRDQVHHEARLLQTQIQLAQGRAEEVLENLKELKNVYQDWPIIEYRLAIAYLMTATPSQAREALDRALRLQPEYPDARLLEAKLDLREGEPGRVVESMQQLLRDNPKLRPARLTLAAAYRMLGRLDETAAIFRAEIAEAPEHFEAHVFLGMILRQQGKADEARAVFETAGTLQPDHLFPAFQLAELDLIAGEADKAQARIDELLKREPDSAVAYFMLGRIHATRKEWDESELAFLKAIELEPKLLQAYDWLIATYLAAKKIPEARVKLENLVAVKPEDASVLIQLALVQEELGELREAVVSYERAIGLVPDFAPALNNLAWLYVAKLDEPEKALVIARKARFLLPEDGRVADTLGWVLYHRKEYAQAIALLREAISKLPDDPEVNYHLGRVAYMMGQGEEARRALTVAVNAKVPFAGQEEAREFLARLSMADPGNQTLPELQARVAENPKDVVALLSLAEGLELRNEDQSAKEIYERVRAINPKQMESVLGLARLYRGPLMDTDRAIELAKEARALDPADARPLAILGGIELAAGRPKHAFALLSRALESKGRDAQVVRDHGWAAYQIGEIQLARESMETLLELDSKSGLEGEARTFLALTKPDLELNPEVVEQAELVLKGAPDHAPALMIIASQAVDEDPNRTEKIYTDLLAKFPDFSPAMKTLAALYLRRGENLEKAKELVLEVRRTHPDDMGACRILGEVSFHLKDYPYAILLLKELDAKGSIDGEGLYYWGAAQMAQNPDSAEGKAKLKQAIERGLPEALEAEAHARLKGAED